MLVPYMESITDRGILLFSQVYGIFMCPLAPIGILVSIVNVAKVYFTFFLLMS